jgi:hypothetical protein
MRVLLGVRMDECLEGIIVNQGKGKTASGSPLDATRKEEKSEPRPGRSKSSGKEASRAKARARLTGFSRKDYFITTAEHFDFLCLKAKLFG